MRRMRQAACDQRVWKMSRLTSPCSLVWVKAHGRGVTSLLTLYLDEAVAKCWTDQRVGSCLPWHGEGRKSPAEARLGATRSSHEPGEHCEWWLSGHSEGSRGPLDIL